jgi:hypothetical protein
MPDAVVESGRVCYFNDQDKEIRRQIRLLEDYPTRIEIRLDEIQRMHQERIDTAQTLGDSGCLAQKRINKIDLGCGLIGEFWKWLLPTIGTLLVLGGGYAGYKIRGAGH